MILIMLDSFLLLWITLDGCPVGVKIKIDYDILL